MHPLTFLDLPFLFYALIYLLLLCPRLIQGNFSFCIMSKHLQAKKSEEVKSLEVWKDRFIRSQSQKQV